MRAMLDELMGTERDVPLDQRTGRGRHYSVRATRPRPRFEICPQCAPISSSARLTATLSTQDREVCKYYLCGFDVTCFKNTRSDTDVLRIVGPEQQDALRDDALRRDFAAAPAAERARTGYERDTKAVLDRMIRECDRRIERGAVRAKAERDEAMAKAATSADADALKLLEAKMKTSAEKAERLGEDGDVDGAEAEYEHCETLKKRYVEVKKKLESLHEYRLTEPCLVSGTLLSSTDTEERRADHLAGKQYQGWLQIRKLRDELAETLARYERDGLLDGDADGERRRSGGRSRSPDRRRERRSRSRDRDRDRDRDGRRGGYGRGRDDRDDRRGGSRRYEPYRRDDRRYRDDRDDRRRDRC